ncbi:hypothetical protein GWI33_008817 [Rhynchophorus ferrugineus]|uniref:Uncharacterized protein n=1 Tax=Rhynchophorus ferrugineus TaxID=354439 RepID=A0A834IBP3_RHYFE|nr:hypothetical protein GWI33_008817 [Rhynchophorus ferrugineus]
MYIFVSAKTKAYTIPLSAATPEADTKTTDIFSRGLYFGSVQMPTEKGREKKKQCGRKSFNDPPGGFLSEAISTPDTRRTYISRSVGFVAEKEIF